LFKLTRGALLNAATSIKLSGKPSIGIITGFYIPHSKPPAAETDGPLGVALLAAGLKKLGIECRIATDEACKGACEAALRGAGIEVPLDIIRKDQPVDGCIERWKQLGITHAISVERCGKSIDGTPRNMRGIDISADTVLLDGLFQGGPWTKIAIGDGGNEIGMGSIPRDIIARDVKFGDTIACVTPADYLIVAGVSNWGAYALLGALACSYHDETGLKVLDVLQRDLHKHILETMINEGPAVDGVTGQKSLSVDGIPVEKHQSIVRTIWVAAAEQILNDIGKSPVYPLLRREDFHLAGPVIRKGRFLSDDVPIDTAHALYVKGLKEERHLQEFYDDLDKRQIEPPEGRDNFLGFREEHVASWTKAFPRKAGWKEVVGGLLAGKDQLQTSRFEWMSRISRVVLASYILAQWRGQVAELTDGPEQHALSIHRNEVRSPCGIKPNAMIFQAMLDSFKGLKLPPRIHAAPS
jgi:hypothetical protein